MFVGCDLIFGYGGLLVLGLEAACTTSFIGVLIVLGVRVCIVFIMYLSTGCVYFAVELLWFVGLCVGFCRFCVGAVVLDLICCDC